MNTPNNKRGRDSQERIESAFVQLLQNNELNRISVTDICKTAQINRTTFYANYIDIYGLADAVQKRLEDEVLGLYQNERKQKYNSNDFLKLFRHIKENAIFNKTYFKLGLDGKFQITEYDIQLAAELFENRYIEYHLEFFRHGFNAIIKMWLQNGCLETPEEMDEIIRSEYLGRE